MTRSQARLFDDGVDCGAIVRAPYRYAVWHTWALAKPRVLWVLFNPSPGTAVDDDPTLQRCLAFSEAWGFGGLDAVSLYAIQSAAAFVVYDHPDPVGPENDRVITEAAGRASSVVAAWGRLVGPRFFERVAVVERAVIGHGLPLECLGQTFTGAPKHPLYLNADLPRRPFRRVG